jgi:hypothetical protein
METPKPMNSNGFINATLVVMGITAAAGVLSLAIMALTSKSAR